jgi:DhnA family fructose-bisphosphate aldolase class Ia
MSCAKSLRMRRLFGRDRRLLLVAMDHAAFTGPQPGLDLKTLGIAVAAGADAIMTTYGTARRVSESPGLLGQAALVLSLDVHAAEPAEQVERAIRLGADSVKVLAGSGHPKQWAALERYALACDAWGMPFQAEVIPGSFEQRDQHTPDNVARVCRQAAEMGADYVKSFYTGDPETMQRVVEGTGVPVVILGGERSSDEAGLLAQVRDALSAGVAGVAFGRNIWSHSDPAGMTRKLLELVHA